jgi:hypothetical protein
MVLVTAIPSAVEPFRLGPNRLVAVGHRIGFIQPGGGQEAGVVVEETVRAIVGGHHTQRPQVGHAQGW